MNLAAAVGVVAFAVGGALGAGLLHLKWRGDFNQQRAEIAEGRGAALLAEVNRANAAEAKATEAEGRVAALEQAKQKVRIIYRDAARADPKCAEQLAQPLLCPRSW